MKLKDSTVNLQDVHWRIFQAAIIAEQIFAKYGSELVITSANDGKHKADSLHYAGKALDLRTWHVSGREGQVVADLQRALGDDFDCVAEADHIHIELDTA